jgi:hypothetical protein
VCACVWCGCVHVHLTKCDEGGERVLRMCVCQCVCICVSAQNEW